MRKLIVTIVTLISVTMLDLTCSAQQSSCLNNKILTPDKAKLDGNVVMISYDNSISTITHTNMEIYNIHKLDDFIQNMSKGKSGRILIVKYVNSNSKIWVNKLCELRYNGNTKNEICYDVYTDPNAFIPLQPHLFYSVKKYDYPDAIRYETCFAKDGKDCALLISFAKSSIVNETFR